VELNSLSLFYHHPDDFSEAPLVLLAPTSKEETYIAASATGATATTEETNEDSLFDTTKTGSSHYNITASAFASPPDNSSN
jgi:hypothetical protein